MFGQIGLKALATGIASFLPVARNMTCRGTSGTSDPRYCYSVWLRHLLKARASGFKVPFRTVAELGPGDSLGIGLSALLCGSEHYIALDAIMHARFDANVAALGSIARLFLERSPVPGEDEFPRVNPQLESYDFPGSLFAEMGALNAIRPERLAAIESELADVGNPDNSLVRYAAPWHSESVIEEGTVDLVLSQAVLEHVLDIPTAYRAIARWLKPGGLFSSVVDLRSHGLSKHWWGHWSASDAVWHLVRGTRPYLINRLPCSAHLAEIEKAGLHVVSIQRIEKSPPGRHLLAKRFRALSDDDLKTSGFFIQAVK